MTGRTLVGYAEVEMETMDGGKHWYPVDQHGPRKARRSSRKEIRVEESPQITRKNPRKKKRKSDLAEDGRGPLIRS